MAELPPNFHGTGGAVAEHGYYCADHTGVANAYRVSFANGGAVTIIPLTNMIGGVLACVPSPDGKTLALVDHDADGPFIAMASADPARPIPALPPGSGNALTATPYSGLAELRPFFWAPSSFAVPEGGYGVYGLAADPLFTQVVQGGAGVGLTEQEPLCFWGPPVPLRSWRCCPPWQGTAATSCCVTRVFAALAAQCRLPGQTG